MNNFHPTPMSNIAVTGLLNIRIGPKSLSDLTAEAMAAVHRERPGLVFACANPHSLVTAREDPVFTQALLDADQVVADGAGIALMGKLVGAEVGPRITGTDYFFSVMKELERKRGGRIFFFGSSQKVLDLIARRMDSEFKGLTLCGSISPPFRAWSEEENQRMLDRIQEAKPDVLWVGMTAPKQEKWVFQNRHALDVPLIGSIGAVFDFFAGTYPRAPQWMCNWGLEWAFRLVNEPKRMWRRNFISTPKFIFAVLWNHVLLRKTA